MRFELWETPFTRSRSPSVFLVTETHGDSTVTVVVAPKGVEEYPKYVIEFSSVYAFSCEEEAGSLSYAGALKEQRSEELGCSYIWQDSPQAITYGTFVPDMAFHGGNGPVRHYVILGGDYNVGIVAADFPTIRVIENGETITLKYKV